MIHTFNTPTHASIAKIYATPISRMTYEITDRCQNILTFVNTLSKEQYEKIQSHLAFCETLVPRIRTLDFDIHDQPLVYAQLCLIEDALLHP